MTAENVGKDPNIITIIVSNQMNEEVRFRMKPSTKFAKTFKAYSAQTGVDFGAYKFIFDGNRVAPDNTPADLEMEDGDRIDAMMEQLGAGKSAVANPWTV